MKKLLAAVLALSGFSSGSGPASAGDDVFRALPKVDLSVFSFAANPEPLVFSSPDDLARAVDALAPKGGSAAFEQRKESLMRGLEEAGVRWGEESFVVVGDWYGTGMARGRLEVAPAGPGVVKASVVWTVPPPPLTPDTAVFRAAFVVRRAVVTKVVFSGRDPVPVVLAVPR